MLRRSGPQDPQFDMTRFQANPQATLIGTAAIFIWGSLALLTTYTGKVPPFQLTAMTFAVASVAAGMKWIILRQSPQQFMGQPWPVWLVGVGGLFGYHFFYFTALRYAPPAEASLVSYLWPLLIVLMSGLLPGERLRWFHLLGAAVAFVGAVTLILRGGTAFSATAIGGYLAAVICAVVWSGYSVLSRRFGGVPTDSVGGFCMATAILAALCHGLLERWMWPESPSVWAAIIALGVGPVGMAFFAWDIGMKRGDIRLLGVLSYGAPALSTLLLVVFGRTEPSWIIGVGCSLIMFGALIASLDKLRPAKRS